MEQAIIGTAGRFTVYEDGSFSGPAAYVQQVDKERIQRSAALFVHFSAEPVSQLVAVALQTDYAAWLGQREIAAMVTRR